MTSHRQPAPTANRGSKAFDHRRSLGRYGEQLAAQRLKDLGWLILDRNWRCRWGELDLVALEAGVVVLCEVKTRADRGAVPPLAAITRAKHARLVHLGGLWLQERGSDRTHRLRLDAIGVRIHRDGCFEIEHVRGIQA